MIFFPNVIIIYLFVIGQAPLSVSLKEFLKKTAVSMLHVFESENSTLWQDKRILSEITYQLVKKSWRPKSLKYDPDEDLPEYWGSPEEAARMLHEEADVEYVMETAERAESLFTTADAQGRPEYDPGLDTIVLVNPEFNNSDNNFVRGTITALAMRNLLHRHNVFVVDAPRLAVQREISIHRTMTRRKPLYEAMMPAWCALLVQGVMTGRLQPGRVHLMGHSFSGELVGYMARYVLLVFGQKVASVVTLDSFSSASNPHLIHTSRDDARAVYAFHTSSPFYGTTMRIATADFVINDGTRQQECRMHKGVRLPYYQLSLCSHGRVVSRFWYILLYPSRHPVRRCSSWRLFTRGLCDENEEVVIRYPPPTDPPTGTFYMRTGAHKPYGLGEEGARGDEGRRRELRDRELATLRRLLDVDMT